MYVANLLFATEGCEFRNLLNKLLYGNYNETITHANGTVDDKTYHTLLHFTFKDKVVIASDTESEGGYRQCSLNDLSASSSSSSSSASGSEYTFLSVLLKNPHFIKYLTSVAQDYAVSVGFTDNLTVFFSGRQTRSNNVVTSGYYTLSVAWGNTLRKPVLIVNSDDQEHSQYSSNSHSGGHSGSHSGGRSGSHSGSRSGSRGRQRGHQSSREEILDLTERIARLSERVQSKEMSKSQRNTAH